jgi:hypothetical protein
MCTYPSDEIMQSTACLMTPGSDDPWNQTFAENPISVEALMNDVPFGTSETSPGASHHVERKLYVVGDCVGRDRWG